MAKKSLILIALASFLSIGSLFSAYGEEKAITSIPLSFSWDTAPKGGELVGNVYATTSNSEFKVEGAEYDKRDDQWDYGERPVVEVELSAKDGYSFTSTSRSTFSLSGCNAQFKKAEKDEDGSTLILQVYFTRIDGSLPATTAISWNGNTAVWDKVNGAKNYEVQLYKDNKQTAAEKTSDSTYDFSPYINLEGNYTFKVRALGTYSSQAGPWSGASEVQTISAEDAWFISDGKWDKTSSGWRYIYPNDAYPAGSWRCINNNWYYFDHDGYMAAECYVKSSGEELYYWLGDDGVWNTEKDTAAPESGARVLR